MRRARATTTGNAGNGRHRAREWVPTFFQCPLCRKRISIATGKLVDFHSEGAFLQTEQYMRHNNRANSTNLIIGIISRLLGFVGLGISNEPIPRVSLQVLRDIFPNHPLYVVESALDTTRSLEAAIDLLLSEQLHISTFPLSAGISSNPSENQGLRLRLS
jgi:hypothetical protein